MTLCTAWIRQVGDTEELIFATDSCLTGGEKWKHGIKLFELPRKDCLLCFAGSTLRAYPLVLNTISSIQFDKYLQSTAASLDEVLDFLCELFSKLVNTVAEVDKSRIHDERGSAEFLFGGWDWRLGKFRVWKLFYTPDVEGFISKELTDDSTQTIFYTFIGNARMDVLKEAKDRLIKILSDDERFGKKLDMEPLMVLSSISLDPSIREVDGSLQIAKIYKSSRAEFFGIYWESSKGKPCFQGREYHETNKPMVRYFNPDTFEILESELPNKVCDILPETYLNDFELVRDSYDENDFLKPNLPEKTKHQLRMVFKELAYKQFIERQELAYNEEEEEEAE